MIDEPLDRDRRCQGREQREEGAREDLAGVGCSKAPGSPQRERARTEERQRAHREIDPAEPPQLIRPVVGAEAEGERYRADEDQFAHAQRTLICASDSFATAKATATKPAK